MRPTSLAKYIELLDQQSVLIARDRTRHLDDLAERIYHDLESNNLCRIMSIDTQNDRRSQSMEAWIVAAAQYYDVAGIATYSGGIKPSAFDMRMILAMRQVGFHMVEIEAGTNPHYVLTPLQATALEHTMYSKCFDDPFNPPAGYIAILMDSNTDTLEIPDTVFQLSLPYTDPTIDDNTPMEYQTYMEVVEEIGREMVYLIKKTSRYS